MKPKIKKRPLLVIEWIDTGTSHIWRNEAQSLEETPLYSESVGWKLPSSKGAVVITPMRNESDQCADRQVIPKACIKSIRRVE